MSEATVELFDGQDARTGMASLFLLAGGAGSRMAEVGMPLGLTKLLLPVSLAGITQPMIGHVLDQAIDSVAVSSVVVLTSEDERAQPDQIESYVQSKAEKRNFQALSVVREPVPLGTAGAVLHALSSTAGNRYNDAVISPSDTLFPFSQLGRMLTAHQESPERLLTWALTSNPGPLAQNPGKIMVDAASSRVRGTLEGEEGLGIVKYNNTSVRRLTSVGTMAINCDRFTATFEQAVGLGRLAPKSDLYRDFIPAALELEEVISSYDVGSPAHDLGEPDRYHAYGMGN